MTPRASIVIPVYNEGPGVTECLDRVFQSITTPCEVLVVYDSPEDTTAPFADAYSQSEPRVKPTLNTYGPGPAQAIRFGMDHAAAPVVVVTMSDGSDDATQLDQLIGLVEGGAVVAAGSRYAKGGAQIGGPRIKRLLSRTAGISLHFLAGVEVTDATSSFKAYSADFLKQVGVQSDAGFELAIELVVKAHRLRLPVAELPTTWRDRTAGESNFKLTKWLPKYLRWYLIAFGPRLTQEQLDARARRQK
ncbi:MAG: glycosyltransferase [Actinomycetota bacterium]